MVYRELALKEVPRLLSLLDRNSHSPSFGCFDRQYWKYRTRDYSNMRMQEACYTLALLYKRPGNTWFRDEKIRDYSIAAMRFWAERQNRDGSFNEYMPGEHSHVATAFSTYAVARACQLLGVKEPVVLEALKRAGKWLGRNNDMVVVNHDAGAIPALYLVYKLTGDGRFLELCKEKVRGVMGSQDAEGWFPEYGGADIGYQSFSVYYLASYWRMSRDPSVLGGLKRAVDFFSYFVHPDLSMGGHYGSRETSLIIPAGFELLSGEIPLAGTVSQALRAACSNRMVVGPWSFDDRFLADCLYPYLEVEEAGASGAVPLPKDRPDFTKYFKGCGLYVRKGPGLYMVFNTRKGGVGKVFGKEKLVYSDTGWVSKADKKVVSTNGPSDSAVGKDSIHIRGGFYNVGSRYQTQLTSVGLRFLNSLRLQGRVKSALRKGLITKPGKSPAGFERFIRPGEGMVRITDRFIHRDRLGELFLSAGFSSTYSTIVGLYEKEFPGKEIVVGRTENSAEIIIKPEGVVEGGRK